MTGGLDGGQYILSLYILEKSKLFHLHIVVVT